MFKPSKKIDEDKCLKTPCNCTHIIIGPTGPTGPIGLSDTITIRDTITGEPGTKAIVKDNKTQNNHTLDFIIPMGPTGPRGPAFLRAAYIVTYNKEQEPDGVSVPSGSRLPLERVELDVSNLITLDAQEHLLKFNAIGYYKITFTVSAYPRVTSPDFDPTKDIVSLGFKLSNTDNVYIGVGEWVFSGEAIELISQGIISVPNTNDTYELVNLSKETIYLNTPSMSNIASKSYFSNPLITMVIDYLGRQGS